MKLYKIIEKNKLDIICLTLMYGANFAFTTFALIWIAGGNYL